MKSLLVIAGEASGDLHGGEILKALRDREPGLRIIGIGGARMTPYLDRKLADVQDLGVVGLVEVLKHLPSLFRLKREILRAAQEECIGAALFIDYPGFNLRMASALRKVMPGASLHQYVCPQVWAWKASRIPMIGRTLDTLYCLFDFEPPLFAGYPVEARWIGHPLVDVVKPEVDSATFFRETGLDPERPLVALLPGSRHGEIDRLLPPMSQLVESWQKDPIKKEVQWALALAPTLSLDDVRKRLGGASVTVVEKRGYALCANADAALICSGTATLEAALLGTPSVILYKLHPFTYQIGKLLVRIPHFGLVNVVAGREVVPELLQHDVNPERLGRELERLLDPAVAEPMKIELLNLLPRLGKSGAAVRVAEHLLRKML